MEIIHFNTQKNWRGGERQLAWLMDELAKKGIKQTLFCRKNSKLESYAIDQNIPYHSFSIQLHRLLFISYQLYKIVSRKKDVIIHSHDSKSHTIALLTKLVFQSKCKIIVDRKVMFPIKGWFSKNIKYASNNIDLIICTSHAVKNQVCESTHHKNVVVIGDMIQPNTAIKSNILSSKYNINHPYIIGYVAAMTKEKDHTTFLKTAAEICKTNPEIGFVLVGDGKLATQIKEQTIALKLDKNVHFLGFVTQVPELILEMDVLLFTSTSEGLGSTILDFFMAKKPVVTVKNGGSEELVFQNETGLICNQKDHINLAKSCLKFYSDPVFTASVVEKAYAFANQNFTTESSTEKVIAAYQKVLDA
jgi:glycosyltransferase involved in cell wall biosynthesis